MYFNGYQEAAETEQKENNQEQKRQCKRRLRYGQIIQLRHLFTNKFIEASVNQTSSKDSNFMLVSP